MRARPRPNSVRSLLAIAVMASIGLCGRVAAASLEGAQPLQLYILINGDKTGLLGSFLQLSNGDIAARRSELIDRNK